MRKITVKKFLMLGILTMLIVGVAGCTSSPSNNPTAQPTTQVTTAAPTGTWSGSLVIDNPGSYQFAQGSSVALTVHMHSGTSTPLAGQTITLTSNGQTLATVVTNSNGDASATITTVGWTLGYHSITASNLGVPFAATGFSVIAAK